MLTAKTVLNKRSGVNKGFLVFVAVVLVVVGYIGFRWMRGLLMLGYVDSAIGRMRTLSTTEAQFAQAHPTVGYTCEWSQLPESGEVERLLRGNGIDNGYAFEITGCQAPDAGRPTSVYYTSARPLHSGQPAFCSDQSGVLRADYGGSVEKCRVNGDPL
jgi:hypothetical protein